MSLANVRSRGVVGAGGLSATKRPTGRSRVARRGRRASEMTRAESAANNIVVPQRSAWSPLESVDLIPSWARVQEDKPPLKVTFGGAGIFFWWELGAVMWLAENFDMSKVPMAGASGGALAATLAACNVDPYKALDVANRLGKEYDIWDRPMGLFGVWGNIIRIWLDELLPENAAEICSNQVEVVVTTLPLFQLDSVSEYTSKEDLIQANMASSHVPWVLDGQPVTPLRGKLCLDGSFQDFLKCGNSCYLTCEGNALLFDYFQDEDLKFDRFDFLSLKNYDEVLRLMDMGYAFAEKKFNRGELQKFDTSFCSLSAIRLNKLLGMIKRRSRQQAVSI